MVDWVLRSSGVETNKVKNMCAIDQTAESAF